MNAKQLRELIIRPTLKLLNLYSLASENLILYTACQESNLTYLKQLGTGPAIGIYQMEPRTHDDIWRNYLGVNTTLATAVHATNIPGMYEGEDAREMAGNLYYATAMCRIHYRRVKEPLPSASDIKGLASYWKKYYNTHLGAGTPEEFIRNAKKYGDL